ncbi:MAG: hypothetical protein KOO63_03820 [Bacteroidales bacterium]|nr:hypothetical protein [Candidatus Latescibacterota bacterium]
MKSRQINMILLLSILSLFISLPGPLNVISGFLQSFYIPGLVLLALSGFKPRFKGEPVLLSFLLSPVILSISVLLVSFFVDSFPTALRFSLFGFYLILAIILVMKKTPVDPADESLPTGIFIISGAFACTIALSYIFNDILLIRSDAWYHASVVAEISKNGIPPMETWLADSPIRYMWIYHLFLASWKNLSGLTVFPAMGFFNVMSALSFPFLISRVVSVFSNEKKYLLWVPAFSIAGMVIASWVLWPLGLARALSGEVRGMEEITRILGQARVQLDGVAVTYFLTPYKALMINFLDKFITVTPFSYSLDLFLLGFSVILFSRVDRSITARNMVTLFVSALGALLFHVIIGISFAGTAVGTGILLCVLSRIRKEKGSFAQSAAIPVTALLAILASYPYISSLGATSTNGGNFFAEHFHLGITNAITIFFPLIILFPFLFGAIRKIAVLSDRKYSVLAAVLICLLGLNLFFNLPTHNESKLLFPFFLVLGIPVFIEIIKSWSEAARSKKTLLSLWLALLFLVPLLLTFRGYLITEPRGTHETRRQNLDENDRLAYEWILENTSPNAVIAEDNTYHIAPVLSARHSLYSDMGVIKVLGYTGNRYEYYKRLQNSLFSPETPIGEAADLAAISELDLYVVVWTSDLENKSFLSGRFENAPGNFTEVYNNPKVKIFKLIKKEGKE